VLDFLQSPTASNVIGYRLMLLAALRMICDKGSQVGLGRIVALYYRSSTSSEMH
jgi:hypothetical protein